MSLPLQDEQLRRAGIADADGETLAASEARFRALAELTPVAMVQLIGGRVTYANPAAARILEYGDRDLLGLGIDDLAHPDDAAALGQLLSGVEESSRSARRELRLVSRRGETRWIDMVAKSIDVRGERSVLLTGIDVTRSKAVQSALVESEAKWKSLATNAPDLILTADLDGTIRFINRGGPALDRHLVVGQSIFDHIHPNHHPEVRTCIQEVIELGEARDYVVAGSGTAGETLWYESRVGPVHRDGRVAALLIITRDITERRSVEERIRRREAELAHVQRLNMVGEIGSGLAHELNQPLTAIGNYAFVLHQQLEALDGIPADALARLNGIIEQSLRAGTIIKQLRDFLRRHEPERHPAHLNDVIREALEFIQQELSQHQVQVQLDFEDLPVVAIDRVQMQQVVINLVLNGIEAMTQVPIAERSIRIETRGDADNVHVTVHDHGCGLPEKVRQRVFEQFFTTKSRGLGMGLPICRTIVEMHGGHLWAEQRHPQGATFVFCLPVLQGDPE